MKNINVTAASQQVAGNRAEEQEEKKNLRVIKIKPVGNAKMFRTLAKAIAAGATTLIVTTRVDVAGCGYVWFGIRKGDTELVQEEYAKAFHTDCAEHIYPLSDCDRLQRINPRLKMKELFREIVRQLEILEQNRTWNEYYFLREEIQSQVPMMVDAYYALGAAEIERHNYNMNAIGKQIADHIARNR